MAFSDQIHQLCQEVGAEQAMNLREFMVDLAGRVDANRDVMNTGLKTLMQEATDEGFAADELLATLQHLAKATVPVEAQARFAADLEHHMANNTTISELTEVVSFGYPDLKTTLLELVAAAITERQSISHIAGGTNNQTSHQKRNTYIGQGEYAVALALGIASVKQGCSKSNHNEILEELNNIKESVNPRRLAHEIEQTAKNHDSLPNRGSSRQSAGANALQNKIQNSEQALRENINQDARIDLTEVEQTGARAIENESIDIAAEDARNSERFIQDSFDDAG